jgi:hypothetical protein
MPIKVAHYELLQRQDQLWLSSFQHTNSTLFPLTDLGIKMRGVQRLLMTAPTSMILYCLLLSYRPQSQCWNTGQKDYKVKGENEKAQGL